MVFRAVIKCRHQATDGVSNHGEVLAVPAQLVEWVPEATGVETERDQQEGTAAGSEYMQLLYYTVIPRCRDGVDSFEQIKTKVLKNIYIDRLRERGPGV